MSTKHTPGKWIVGRMKPIRRPAGGYRQDIYKENAQQIGLAFGKNPAEAQSNALMFAAALELLQTLIKAKEDISTAEYGEGVEFNLRFIVSDLDKAIAKATGEKEASK